jgi:hypothetical protein
MHPVVAGGEVQDHAHRQTAKTGDENKPVPGQPRRDAVQLRDVLGAVEQGLHPLDPEAEGHGGQPRGDAHGQGDEPEPDLPAARGAQHAPSAPAGGKGVDDPLPQRRCRWLGHSISRLFPCPRLA